MEKNNGKRLLQTIFLEKWHPYLWIVLIGFLLYFQTLFFNFSYFDDNVLVLDNFHFISKLSNIIQAFREDVFLNVPDAYYRPIMTISLIFDAQFGKISPWMYHFSNVLIHLLAAILVFLLLKKLGYDKALSFFFSLIFTVHPVLTQAVAWIPGRNDSLLGIFVFLSFIYFLKFLETKKYSHYFFHLLAFFLAFLTKEIALALPLICLFYLHFIVKEKLFSFNKKVLAVGWFFVFLLWFFLRESAFKYPLEMTIFDMAKSVFNNFPALIQFIGKAFFPFNLSVLPIIQDTTFIYGILATILLALLVLFTKNKRLNFIVFGSVWFLVFLLPSFIRPNPDIVADFIEHRIYIPIIGIFILLLETDLTRNIRKRNLLIFGGLILLIFSLITILHSRNFKDRLSFWENAAKNSPHSPLAQRNLGAMYYLDGQLDKAEPRYRKSLELNPFEQMAHNNLGLIYMQKNKLEEAEIELKKELEINPLYDTAYFNLGALYYKEGKLKEAEALWKKTLEINPNYISAYYNLAAYYYEQKDQKEALYYISQLQKMGIQISLPQSP